MFNTGATAFTTGGTPGGTAGVGLTSISAFTVTTSSSLSPTLAFGGAPGVGTANCLQTGWTNAPAPGPAEHGETSPMTPPGTTTPLVSTTPTFQPGAYVNLNPNPPTVPASTSYNMGTGATIVETLPATQGTYPIVGCQTVGSPSQPDISVTISNTPTPCVATISKSDTVVETATFQYQAYDNQSTPNVSNTGTVTLNIGTPPVDQAIGQQVNAGQLILSCNGPGTSGYPTATEFDVSDHQPAGHHAERDSPDDNGPGQHDLRVGRPWYPDQLWTLTTYLVPTSSNTNPHCSTVATFCDQSTGSGSGNAIIPASDLAISTPVCAAYTGTTNPVTPGVAGNYGATQTLCSAAAGTSGGTFTMNTDFSLTIPPTVYAGNI